MAPATPTSAHRCGEPLPTEAEHEVGVGHHRDRHAGVQVGEPSSTAGGVMPAARARSFASWMTGPSMTGSENGMPTSMASAPATAAARDHPVHRPEPAGEVGHEALAAGVPVGPQRGLEVRARSPSPDAQPARRLRRAAHPRISIICATSLSPRPDRLTSTVLPASDARSRHPGDGVGRLERGDDPLGPRQQLERGDHLGVGHARVAWPGPMRTGGRAPGRRPGSRGRRRSTGPRSPARTRPA